MKYLRIIVLITGMVALWSVVGHADDRDDAVAALKAAQTAIAQAQANVARASATAPPVVAQVAVAGPVVDMTGISVAVIGALGLIINSVALAYINSHVKDKQAAETLDKALTNALGAMQQSAEGAIVNWNPKINLPASIPPNMVIGVQYALDHAGEEAERLGITPLKIADKLNARIGLAEIQTNISTAASDAPSPKPLDPIPSKQPVSIG